MIREKKTAQRLYRRRRLLRALLGPGKTITISLQTMIVNRDWMAARITATASNGEQKTFLVPGMPRSSRFFRSPVKHAFLLSLSAFGVVPFKFNYELCSKDVFSSVLGSKYPELTSSRPVDAIITAYLDASSEFPPVIGPLTVQVLNDIIEMARDDYININVKDVAESISYRTTGRAFISRSWETLGKHYPFTASFVSSGTHAFFTSNIASFKRVPVYEYMVLLFEKRDFSMIRRILVENLTHHGRRFDVRFDRLRRKRVETTVVFDAKLPGGKPVKYTGLIHLDNLLYFTGVMLDDLLSIKIRTPFSEFLKLFEQYLDRYNKMRDRKREFLVFPAGDGVLVRSEEPLGDKVDCAFVSSFEELREMYKTKGRPVLLEFKNSARLPVSFFNSWKEKLAVVMTGCANCEKYELLNPHMAVGTHVDRRHDETYTVVGLVARKDGRTVIASRVVEDFTGKNAILTGLVSLMFDGYEPYDTRNIEDLAESAGNLAKIRRIIMKNFYDDYPQFMAGVTDNIYWVQAYIEPSRKPIPFAHMFVLPARRGTSEYYRLVDQIVTRFIAEKQHRKFHRLNETMYQALSRNGLVFDRAYNTSPPLAGFEYGNLYILVRPPGGADVYSCPVLWSHSRPEP